MCRCTRGADVFRVASYAAGRGIPMSDLRPTLVSFTPEGHIVIAQQRGRVKIWTGSTVSTTPYLTLTVTSSSDRGVLEIAFDPDYATNRYVYGYYHRPAPTIHGVISRFVVRPDALSANPATETVPYEMVPDGDHHFPRSHAEIPSEARTFTT